MMCGFEELRMNEITHHMRLEEINECIVVFNRTQQQQRCGQPQVIFLAVTETVVI